MANKVQHLAMFLDGTWNTEDDSTNVLNAFHFTFEGFVEEKNVIQKRYYDRGVGTSMFNSVRGGGLGVGLEKNVREAYNWLVDNYNDGDRIYIFGFSRGAYTARSLVSFIGSVGLVRRGAPLTTTQLWNGYSFISQHRGKAYPWWKKMLEKPQYRDYFGRITDLKYQRNKEQPMINKTERLLVKWSRRVDISYLGIYDTVGALGIEALGIPGLKGSLAASHNSNPTSIIKKCRHALAIDEHRSSFRLTPILDYVRNNETGNIESYKNVIEQRWFPGAHSNIGGGYPNNVLFLKPFEWIMKGAEEMEDNKGLALLEIEPPDVVEEKEDVRDSYAELAGNVYPHFIRSKRYHRPIGRDDLVRSGYTLRPINEEVDQSAIDLAKADSTYAPPNLLSYFRRHPKKETNKILNDPKRISQFNWPGEITSYAKEGISLKDKIMSRVLLVLWSVFAAFGLVQMARFFWIKDFTPNEMVFPIIAALYVLIDWAEAKTTLGIRFFPRAVRLETVRNALYWQRLLAIVAFFTGLAIIVIHSLKFAWATEFSLSGLINYVKTLAGNVGEPMFLYSIYGSLAMLILLELVGGFYTIKDLDKLDLSVDQKSFSKEVTEQKGNHAILILALLTAIGLVTFVLLQCNVQVKESIEVDRISIAFLLICLLFMTLYYLFLWVDKPIWMNFSRSESIIKLYGAYSKSRLESLYDEWTSNLSRKWFTEKDKQVLKELNINEDASDELKSKTLGWLRLRELLRKALWRDLLGFIPLYVFILGAILCIGNTMFISMDPDIEILKFYKSIPFWFGLVLLTAVFDLLENFIHLRHVSNYTKGGSSGLLVGVGALFSFLKYVGFMVAALLSAAVLILMAKEILTQTGNIRWMITIGFVYILIFSLVSGIIVFIKNKLST